MNIIAEKIKLLEKELCEYDDKISSGEAKLRRLFKKNFQNPLMSDCPDWLINEIKKYPGSHNLSISENLIRSVLHYFPNLKARIENGFLNRLEVHWETESTVLRWCILDSELPYPGLKVRVYSQTAVEDHLQAKTFWVANSLVDYSLGILKNEEHLRIGSF